MMTKTQTTALATYARTLRPDWDHPGIVAAITKALETTGDPFDIGRALVTLAENPQAKTPALLPQPGNHWRRPTGELTPRRGDHNIPCIDHPDQNMPCRKCARTARPATPDEVATMRAELAAHRPPRPRTSNPHEPEHNLDQTRARIDQEPPQCASSDASPATPHKPSATPSSSTSTSTQPKSPQTASPPPTTAATRP